MGAARSPWTRVGRGLIGVATWAVDVARILARDPQELHANDVPQPVLDALHASKVREVHMIGRRGPAHAKFTTKELRELGELPGVELVVHADEADLNAFDLAGEGVAMAESDRRVRGNLVAITKGPRTGRRRPRPPGTRVRLTVRFWLRPTEILGTERVEGNHPRAHGDQRRREIRRHRRVRDAGRADGAAFRWDTRASRCPACRSIRGLRGANAQGRVLGEDGAPLPGEYVAGWLKRGPTGVIGTNKSDAAENRPLPARGPGRRPGRGRRSRCRGLACYVYPDPAAPADAEWRWPACSPGAASSRSPTPSGCASRPPKPIWPRRSAAASGVKLHNAEAIWSACRPPPPNSPPPFPDSPKKVGRLLRIAAPPIRGAAIHDREFAISAPRADLCG